MAKGGVAGQVAGDWEEIDSVVTSPTASKAAGNEKETDNMLLHRTIILVLSLSSIAHNRS